MKPKVLLVDDDPLMHVLYKRHLEQAGFELVSANDPSTVVELASRESPQLILMDVVLPGIDGLTLVRQLKRMDATKSIPITVITSNLGAHNAIIQEANMAGAISFLPKPFSPVQLLEEVRRLTPQSFSGTDKQ